MRLNDKMNRPVRSLSALLCFALALAFGQASSAEKFSDPLPPEPIPANITLDTPYPPGFVVVYDFGFGSLIDSAFSLVDTESGQFKGMMSGGNFATMDVSFDRQQFYIGETYYSRGTRGERSDLVTVYDMKNLDRVAEIELPPKRAAIVVNKGVTGITASGKFMLVFNLTPATSVTVIDLDELQVVNEVETPGCSLVYPTDRHDFFMLCGDGGLLNISLDSSGQVRSQSRREPFIDIDADPLSEKSSKIGDTWYFISFKGDVQPITGKGEVMPRWPLLSPQERAEGWRPGGWHWTAGHPDGLLWVGMTPDGYDGSHKDPAKEIWLYDVAKQNRTAKISLREMAISIDVTVEEEPRLLVVNAAGSLDIYDAHSGSYQKSIHDLGASPYQVYRIR